jgi:hypothetical protein
LGLLLLLLPGLLWRCVEAPGLLQAWCPAGIVPCLAAAARLRCATQAGGTVPTGTRWPSTGQHNPGRDQQQQQPPAPAAPADEGPEEAAQRAQRAREEAAAAARLGPHRVVAVQRPADIEEARQGLPITGMEQEVVEAVALDDVVVLCGQTGCGKTTQVGRLVWAAWWGCAAGNGRPLLGARMGRLACLQPSLGRCASPRATAQRCGGTSRRRT